MQKKYRNSIFNTILSFMPTKFYQEIKISLSAFCLFIMIFMPLGLPLLDSGC